MRTADLQVAPSLCFLHFSLCSAQLHLTMAPPSYSAANYVLMVLSVFLILSLVLGLLWLVRKHNAVKCSVGKGRSSRRQVIQVKPPDAPQAIQVKPPPAPQVILVKSPPASRKGTQFSEEDMIIEDLVDDQVCVLSR